MDLADGFNAVSKQYDTQRRLFLPCFDDFYRVPLAFLDYKGKTPRVLDIGCGTGLFSSFLLEKYQNASITLIDLSEKMLEVARKRFSHHSSFRFIIGDYTQYVFNQPFDIIISALSIHHINAHQKEALFKKVYALLENGGVFINADQALSPTKEMEDLYSRLWKDFVEKSGLTQKEIEMGYERLAYDDPSTLSEQLQWLKQAGFKDVDCVYKYYHFCVFYAKKYS